MDSRAEALWTLLEKEAAKRRLVITGHDLPDVDSVISCVLMKRLLDAFEIPSEIVLPTRADAQSRRVLARFGFDPDAWMGEIREDDGLILVDHHQPLHEGVVLACVDHHHTAYPPEYPYVQIEPCGACAVMVLRLMEAAGLPYSRENTALAVTALYLDTIALKSTKILPHEIAFAKEQVLSLGLDEGFLLAEGLKLEDMSLPDAVLAQRGRKDYAFSGNKVISTYLQTNAMTPERLQAILREIHTQIKYERAALWVFIVHDPVRGRSAQYNVSADGSVKTTVYDYLASRGKDIMPQVEREMREENAEHVDDAAGTDRRA